MDCPTCQPIFIDCPRINLYWVNTEDLGVDFGQELTGVLSPEDWLTINRLSHSQVRNRAILGRGLLRVLLGRALGIPPAKIELASNPWGKPYLPGHALQFNVTHSGLIFIFALSAVDPVGVDVEQIRPLPRLNRLLQRYGTPDEQTQGQNLSPLEQQRYFLELWVAKEAYGKARGTGLTGMLGDFAKLHTLGQTEIAPPGGWPAHLRRFNVGKDYVGAVCWGTNLDADASIPDQTQWVDHSLPQFR